MRASHDVVIVGGGPAGTSAALVLGRCRRAVLVVDEGRPRNAASRCLHGYLTRDGVPPATFRELGAAELRPYDVQTWAGVVADVRGEDGAFRVVLEDGREATCRKVLIATGVRDEIPPIPGIDAYFGISVHLCPYCDGWEVRDAPVAVYGRGRRGFEMTRAMTAWTRDLVLCTDGPSGLGRRAVSVLAQHRIPVVEARIVGLDGEGGRLEALRFDDGRRIARAALFFDTPSHTRSALAERLGCRFDPKGGVRCDRYASTDVPGLYAAGNVTRDVQLVIVAAAEGAKAAFGIHRALTREDFDRRGASARVPRRRPT